MTLVLFQDHHSPIRPIVPRGELVPVHTGADRAPGRVLPVPGHLVRTWLLESIHQGHDPTARHVENGERRSSTVSGNSSEASPLRIG
jgi:hypothetical protein